MEEPAGNRVSSPRRSKYQPCKVLMLDDTIQVFHIAPRCVGRVLYQEVVKKTQLLEADYFDLEFTDEYGNCCWLDPDKPISKQLSVYDTNLKFVVKFYTPDPFLLEEEYTRYLFALQVKRDLATGAMPCQEHTAVLLASYIVQAEFGDYNDLQCSDHLYLCEQRLLPGQTEQIEIKIMNHHMQHKGQSPAEADFNLLDTARKVELYGIRMHPSKDHEGVMLHLAVAHMGVLVLQGYHKINTFSWAKIRKLSFKRKKFLIKLHPEGYGYYKDTVEFYFDSRNECKNFWKKCVEHHAFFRCHVVKKPGRHRAIVMSRGSSFRYSGRTQKELVEYVRENFVKRPPFERSVSMRTMTTLRSAAATPRTGTLTSRDLAYGAAGMHNSTSSGSHTLEISRSQDAVDTQPKTSEPQTVNSFKENVEDPQAKNHSDCTSLTKMEAHKQLSSPDFIAASEAKQNGVNDANLSRSPEVENIPRQVLEVREAENHQSLQRSQSAVATDILPALSPVTEHRTQAAFYYDDSGSAEQLDTPGLTANNLSAVTSPAVSHPSRELADEDARKKRLPMDKAYYIAKELLMTERTYKKDLEVISVWFRSALTTNDTSQLAEQLFISMDLLYNFHCGFLKELEQRLATWEGKSTTHLKSDCQKIGDIMLESLSVLPLYTDYMEQHDSILSQLELGLKRSTQFEQAYRDFEAQKVCYLPLNTFLLKPAQRLLHYKLILERLMNYYGVNHLNFADCKAALGKILDTILPFEAQMKNLENVQKLIELQRDLQGIENLAQSHRHFIREGCLQKLSRKGYQQRMFFLFSDMLVYTSRTATPSLQFKVHGQLPLKAMVLEEVETKMAVANSFKLYAGNKCLMLAASSQEEKDKWLEDLQTAILFAKDSEPSQQKILYPSLKSNSSADTVEDIHDEPRRGATSPDRHIQHRANTTMHVCWHRNTSVSMRDHNVAIENQLSGYLLRKFKNSNGWQKLWVVFTNFCLFFYKTFEDDFPLASLPLLGYSVTMPAEVDDIQKEFVFKLQFKNHVYFFRAESEYTFERWIEVINSATSTSRRMRMFSRLESTPS